LSLRLLEHEVTSRRAETG